jgi:hypothetical protein
MVELQTAKFSFKPVEGILARSFGDFWGQWRVLESWRKSKRSAFCVFGLDFFGARTDAGSPHQLQWMLSSALLS